MGDAKRNTAFSRFVKTHFPRIREILCIADGKCRLANKLALLGYQVRVIEANPRAKHVRDGVIYQEGWFTRDSQVSEKLIIGMHPDEATSEIILAAEKNNASWAIVPCCIKGPEAHWRYNFEDWLRTLRHLSRKPGAVQREKLPMGGKNTVLWRKIKAKPLTSTRKRVYSQHDR